MLDAGRQSTCLLIPPPIQHQSSGGHCSVRPLLAVTRPLQPISGFSGYVPFFWHYRSGCEWHLSSDATIWQQQSHANWKRTNTGVTTRASMLDWQWTKKRSTFFFVILDHWSLFFWCFGGFDFKYKDLSSATSVQVATCSHISVTLTGSGVVARQPELTHFTKRDIERNSLKLILIKIWTCNYFILELIIAFLDKCLNLPYEAKIREKLRFHCKHFPFTYSMF